MGHDYKRGPGDLDSAVVLYVYCKAETHLLKLRYVFLGQEVSSKCLL